MNVLLLTLFVSLVLAALGGGAFVWTARSRTFDHNDRMAILPFEEDEEIASSDDKPNDDAEGHPRREG